CQCQLETTTHCHSIDRSDDRLVQVAQFLQPGKAADTIITVHCVAFGGLLQIPTGGKELRSSGAHDGDAQLRVIAKILEDTAHRTAGGQIDGIGLGPIQRDFENMIVDCRRDSVCHWMSPYDCCGGCTRVPVFGVRMPVMQDPRSGPGMTIVPVIPGPRLRQPVIPEPRQRYRESDACTKLPFTSSMAMQAVSPILHSAAVALQPAAHRPPPRLARRAVPAAD